jgi:hypothetical protein
MIQKFLFINFTIYLPVFSLLARAEHDRGQWGKNSNDHNGCDQRSHLDRRFQVTFE